MAGAQTPGPLGAGGGDGGWEHPQHRPAESSFSAPGPVGTWNWHAALAHNRQPVSHTAESIEQLKDRARRAVPMIGRQLQAWNGGVGAPAYWAGTVHYGATAVARNTVYSALWHQLPRDKGQYWFQAATMVTGAGGIKSMEGRLASAGAGIAVPPTSADLAFVIAGNEFLYPYNLHNFYCLRDGGEVFGFEHLRGNELDRGLVALEQTLIQSFMDAYAWPDREERAASMRRLSAGLTSWLANEWVKAIVTQVFGARFDFGSLDHRIRLGVTIVGRLRNGA